GVGCMRARGQLLLRSPGTYPRLAANELPRVPVERAILSLNFQKCFGIRDGRHDLQPVTHDAIVLQQSSNLTAVIARHPLRIETIESGAVIFPLPQDRVPTQAGLRALEDQELEQLSVVVLRDAPFFIVIADRELIASPFAADADLIFLLHSALRIFLACTDPVQRNSKVTNFACCFPTLVSMCV